MPQFDLRNINIAEYINTNGTITHGTPTSIGDAMGVDITVKHAEGRVYAEGVLAEYLRKAIGGTISVATKYIPTAAQTLMYGARAKTRSISVGSTTKSISSLQMGGQDKPKYVALSCYAPDMIDGTEKYTCVFVTRALFGPPSLSFKTLGETITFSTPTTVGEFLADHQSTQELIEVAICDSVAEAVAWCAAVLD